jgi:hypothetical protein
MVRLPETKCKPKRGKAIQPTPRSIRIAGSDVHKKVLAVVVADVEIDGEHQFERRMFGGSPVSETCLHFTG